MEHVQVLHIFLFTCKLKVYVHIHYIICISMLIGAICNFQKEGGGDEIKREKEIGRG